MVDTVDHGSTEPALDDDGNGDQAQSGNHACALTRLRLPPGPDRQAQRAKTYSGPQPTMELEQPIIGRIVKASIEPAKQRG